MKKDQSTQGRRQVLCWIPLETAKAFRVTLAEKDLKLGTVIAELITEWLKANQKDSK